jgi:hypothetical protein
MLKINFKTILNNMQPRKKRRGNNFIEILSFRLSLRNLSYGVLLDVNKRVNAFLKNLLGQKIGSNRAPFPLQENDITCNIDTCKFLHFVFLYTKVFKSTLV